MNSDRISFATFRIKTSVIVFLLGLVLAPAAALAQTGWHPQNLPAPEAGVTYSLGDIKALSAAEVWLAGGLSTGEAALLKTVDGSTWNLVFRRGSDPDKWKSLAPFTSLSVVDSNHAWGGGLWGMTAYTNDGGGNWFRDASPCGDNPPNVGGTAAHGYTTKAMTPDNVWFAGFDPWDQAGQIWHRPYGGRCEDWGYWPYRLEAQTGYSNMYGLDAADTSNAWAVSSDTFHGGSWVLHTTDGGATWSKTASPGGMYAFDVAAVNPNVAWVVGQGGLIAKTIDGGATWVMQGSGVASTLWKIAAVSTDVAWAVGESGTIIKTTDGGATWRTQVSGTAANVRKLTAVDVNTAWALDDQGNVLATTDGGVYQPLSAPAVSGLSPAGGPIAGGTTPVFVGGRDFRPGARVFFVSGPDRVPAASVEYRSAGELIVTTPPHTAGIVDVVVVNPDGQSGTREKAFAFSGTQPLIVGLNPSYGYVDTTVELDIYGAGLTPNELATDPVPEVNINGTAVQGWWTSYSTVHAQFARSLLTVAGMANIEVITAAGKSNTLPFAINYGSVSVDKPSSLPYNRSVTVQSLSGPVQAMFYGLTWTGWVRVGKVFEQPQWIAGNSPPPPGYLFLPNYYYEISTYPSMHYQAATICFPYAHEDLSAAGFDESKLRLMHYLDNQNAWEDVTFTLDTTAKVICGTSPEPMMYLAIAQGPATVLPPAITEIAPAIGPPAGGTIVTINGSLFAPNATVSFGGVAATNVTVVSGMRITATIPAHPLGFVDVVVTNPNSPARTLVGGFEYVGPPTVTSVTPDRGSQYGYTNVTIKGTGFRSGNGGSIKFGGTAVRSSSMIDDTTITASTPSHTFGPVDVVVTNPDGQSGTLVNGFTYVPAPTVASVTPNAGPVKGGTPVTITGTNFQAGASATFGGTPATNVLMVNSTTVTALTPAHAAGSVLVTVTNPDGQSGNRNSGFTYLLGDLNADGVVDILDAIMVLQVMSARNPVPAVDISADVNNDGAIGLAEAIFILQKAAGIR